MSKLDDLIKELCPDGVEYKELKEVLVIKNGSDYKKYGKGDVPVYGSGGIMTYIDKYVYEKPTVLIPRKGSLDKLYYLETPFWNVDTIYYTIIDTNVALPKYVYHCLLREHLEKLNTAGGVPSLTQTVLNRVKIPVPPPEISRRLQRSLQRSLQRENNSTNIIEIVCCLLEKIKLSGLRLKVFVQYNVDELCRRNTLQKIKVHIPYIHHKRKTMESLAVFLLLILMANI